MTGPKRNKLPMVVAAQDAVLILNPETPSTNCLGQVNGIAWLHKLRLSYQTIRCDGLAVEKLSRLVLDTYANAGGQHLQLQVADAS